MSLPPVRNLGPDGYQQPALGDQQHHCQQLGGRRQCPGSGTRSLNPPGDAVVFEDTKSGVSPITVTLNIAVNPLSVTVSNSTKDYTISGSGGIGGGITFRANRAPGSSRWPAPTPIPAPPPSVPARCKWAAAGSTAAWRGTRSSPPACSNWAATATAAAWRGH